MAVDARWGPLLAWPHFWSTLLYNYLNVDFCQKKYPTKHLPYKCHFNPFLITNRSWNIRPKVTVYNWTAGYNGTLTVFHFICSDLIKLDQKLFILKIGPYPAVTYAAAEHQGHLFWITCKRLKLYTEKSWLPTTNSKFSTICCCNRMTPNLPK